MPKRSIPRHGRPGSAMAAPIKHRRARGIVVSEGQSPFVKRAARSVEPGWSGLVTPPPRRQPHCQHSATSRTQRQSRNPLRRLKPVASWKHADYACGVLFGTERPAISGRARMYGTWHAVCKRLCRPEGHPPTRRFNLNA